MRILSLCTATIALLALTACATTPAPEVDLAAQVAIQLATGKFIEATPDRAARAAKVAEIATQVKGLATGDTATVDELNGYVQKVLDGVTMEPSDRLLVDTLVTGVVDELKKKVSAGVLNANDKLVVAKVLDWIVAAAARYQA